VVSRSPEEGAIWFARWTTSVYALILTLTHPSRRKKVSLKCPPVRPSVRSSVRPQKLSSISMNPWYAGRRRPVMHEGMQYDPIQGQGQGHEPPKVGKFDHSQWLSSPPFIMGAGKWPRTQYLQLMGAVFLVFILVFCVTWRRSWQ